MDPADLDEDEGDACSTCGCECERCAGQVRNKDCEDDDGCQFCLCGVPA